MIRTTIRFEENVNRVVSDGILLRLGVEPKKAACK